MALNILRGMWSHCRYSHQFLKHKRSYFVGNSRTIKDDFLARDNMSTHRQLNVPCLLGNTVCGSPNYKHNPLSFLQKNSLSTCCVHFTSAPAKHIISIALEDVDLEELKKQVREERRKTQNNNVHLNHKIRDLLNARCDEILANLGPEDEKKLKVIQLEHSFMYSEGFLIPSTEEMISQYWLEAMKLLSKNQRLKYYIFLAKRKFTKDAEKSKSAVKKAKFAAVRVKPERYEHGRLFMRIYETTMKRWLNHRLAASMLFGIPLVFDMDYDQHMRHQEIRNTASQLQDVYILNRGDESPFHIHFTGCLPDNPMFRLLQVFQHEEQDVLATVSEKSYLDLFEKKNLVYLSPHGRHVMKEFDPTAVYIIGAFNDKATMQPLSYARAKEQNIKCMRLPLDHHLQWNIGSKNLTLDQIMKIMIAVKNKKSWQEALTAIPKRKLKNYGD